MIGKQSKAMQPYDLAALQKAVDKAEKLAAQNAQRAFRRTVQTWTKKPNFGLEPNQEGDGGYNVTVNGERSDVWNMLDQGTKEKYPNGYDIPIPSSPLPQGKFLVFPTGVYQAKTSPARIEAKSASPRTGALRFAKTVKHPGYEARNWRQKIAERDGERRLNAVRKAIDDFFG